MQHFRIWYFHNSQNMLPQIKIIFLILFVFYEINILYLDNSLSLLL
jgi:hypothetical protein